LLKNKLSFLTVLAVFLLLSCTGSPFSRNNSESAQSQTGQSGISVSALSAQEQQNYRRWICGTQDGKLIIIGVSSKLSKPSDEIEAAKQDAALKASMYHGIQGSVVSLNRTGSNSMEYTSDSTINLNYDTDLTRYLDRLSFDPEKDVTRISGVAGYKETVIVRMKYSAPDLANAEYNSVISGGSPSWINNRDLPEIPGYITVVGLSGKKEQLRGAITSSIHAAAARLIERSSTHMTVSDKTGSSVSSSTSMHSTSEGRLINFRILEFWVADNGSVYTLAIARAAQ